MASFSQLGRRMLSWPGCVLAGWVAPDMERVPLCRTQGHSQQHTLYAGLLTWRDPQQPLCARLAIVGPPPLPLLCCAGSSSAFLL